MVKRLRAIGLLGCGLMLMVIGSVSALPTAKSPGGVTHSPTANYTSVYTVVTPLTPENYNGGATVVVSGGGAGDFVAEASDDHSATSAVPEPASGALLLLGAAGMALVRRCRRSNK